LNPSPKTINDGAHFEVFAPTATRRLIDQAGKRIAREEGPGEQADFEDAHQPLLDDDLGLRRDSIVRAATAPRNFFLINEPFSSGRTRLLMKCGEAADINQPLRAVAQH